MVLIPSVQFQRFVYMYVCDIYKHHKVKLITTKHHALLYLPASSVPLTLLHGSR